MAYSLDQLRDLYPQSLGGLSDAQAINKISSLSGQDPQNLAAQYGVINPDQGDFARGLSSGVDGAQAGLYGLLGYAGDVIGSDTVRDYGYKGYEDNMAEVQLRSKRTDNVENNETAGDWIDSAQYWLGYALPQIVEAIVGSKGVGFVGKKTVERKVKKKVAERFGKENVDRVMKTKTVQNAINKGQKVGSTIGIGTQAVGTELGYTYGGAVDKAIEDGKSTDDIDLLRVTKYGLAAGAAEFAADVATLGLVKIGPAKNMLTSKLGNSSSRIKNAAVKGTIGATLEAGTELAQTGLEEMGAGYSYEEANFSDPTSAFAGAVGGGAMGMAGGAATKGPDSLAQIKRAAEKAQANAAAQDKNNSEQQEEEDEKGAAQAEEDQNLVDRTEQLRETHAPTFQDRGSWVEDAQLEKDTIERIQVLDPSTEIGAAFKEYQKANQEYLSNNQQANQALIEKFIKGNAVPADTTAQKVAYLQALDDYAELQEARANGTRSTDLNDENVQNRNSTLVGLLNDRNAALDTGNMNELAEVEKDVIKLSEKDPLFVAEWEEFKRNAAEQEALETAAAEIEAKESKKKPKKPLAVETPVEAPVEAPVEEPKNPADKVFTFADIDEELVKMSPQQRDIFNYIKEQIQAGNADELYVGPQTKGTGSNKGKGWAATKIAEALGLNKGNIPNQLKRINDAIRKVYGVGIQELTAGINAKEDAGNLQPTEAESINVELEQKKVGNVIDESETLDPNADIVSEVLNNDPGMSIINSPGGSNAQEQKAFVATANVEGGTPEQKIERNLANLSEEERAKAETKINETETREAELAKEQTKKESSPELDEQGKARREEEHQKNLNDAAIIFSGEFIGPLNKKQNKSQAKAIERAKKEIANSWEEKQLEGQPKFDDMSLENRSEWVLATAMALDTGNEKLLLNAKEEIIRNHIGAQSNESKRGNKTKTKKVSKTKSDTTTETTEPGRDPNDAGEVSGAKLRKAAKVKVQVRPKSQASEKDMRALEQETETAIKKEATKRLGKGWQSKHTKLNKLLKAKQYKKFADMVEFLELAEQVKANKLKAARVKKDIAKVLEAPDLIVDKPKEIKNLSVAEEALFQENKLAIESMFLKLVGPKQYKKIRSRIFIGRNVKDLASQTGNSVKELEGTVAFVTKTSDANPDRTAVKKTDPDRIAFNVEDMLAQAKKEALGENAFEAVFMHEVGSHIGLDNILSPRESQVLAAKIRKWAEEYREAKRNNEGTSVEQEVSAQVMLDMASLDYAGGLTDRGKRVVSTSSSNPGAETTKEVKETIAYFIHHAVAKGITPSEKTETGKVLNKFRQAFRKFMGYFLSETDSITGQDIVDMAYGAAFLELGSQFAGADTRTSLVEQRKLTKEQESGVAFNNALIELDRKKQRVGRFRSIEAVNTMRQNAEIDLVLKEINRRKNSDKDNSVDMDFTRNFEKKDYWSDRIDAFIAKRLPKNDKGHYITDNYIPLLADWKKFQDERATLEKNLRKGLRKTANERIKDAAEHEARMNDPDGSLNVDLDYSMNTQEKEENKQEVATIRIWIRDHWGETAAQIWTDFTNIFQGGANSTKFLHQFINDVKDVMPGAKKWHDAILMLEKTRNEIKQTVDDIAIRAREMSEKNLIRVNQFIEKSTVEQLWGYNPYKKTDPRYKKVKIDPEMQKIFESLNKEQKQLAVDVFAHGDLMLKRKRDIARAFGVSDNFFGVSGLEGPYAPLRRFGNYVAEFKSQAYLDAEAALEDKPNENNRNALEKLKADSKEYEVSFHGSMGKAEAYVDTNKKRFAYAEASEKTKINSESNSPDYQVLSKVLAGLRASDFGKDTAEYKAIKEMIENMYFDTLSEDNARRSQAKRKSIAGYETNMMRSFLANATAEANLIANMEHGTDVNVALLEARKEKNKPGNKAKLSRVYNLMVSHYASNLNQRPTPIQDRVAALNTVYMLTSSIGYHITNATQPIMVTIPKLVGDFGATNYGKTMKLYWQGLSMARDVVTFNAKNFKFQTAIDIDKAPLKYQPLLKELQLRQLLDVGIEQDLAEFNRSDSGYDFVNKATAGASNFAHRLYQIARLVEAYNRISTATAAFEMAQANPEVIKRLNTSSTEYAISIVQDTQGNFSAMDAPLLLKKLPKITGQYRKYQIMMAWVYADATKKAFRGTSPEEKAAGKRTVGFALGHAAMFSGMTGVPVLGMVAPLFMGIGNEGGEEPEDLERWIQDNVGDEMLGTVISRGLPALFGIDMSTKLSQQKIFNPLPYSEFSADQESMRNLFFEAVSGPFGATASNAIRSIEYAKEGNVWRSLEYALPKGVRTAMESYRLGTEGYSLRNGDVVATPDDFTGWGLALNALGIPATDINKIKWTRGQQYELNDWFEKEQSKIRKRYVEAKQDRNNKEAKKQMLAWKDLQKSKDRVRPFFNNERSSLRKTPLSSLLKAVRQQQKRQDKYRKQLGTN